MLETGVGKTAPRPINYKEPQRLVLYGIKHVQDELGFLVVGLEIISPTLVPLEVVEKQDLWQTNISLVDPIQNREA